MDVSMSSAFAKKDMSWEDALKISPPVDSTLIFPGSAPGGLSNPREIHQRIHLDLNPRSTITGAVKPPLSDCGRDVGPLVLSVEVAISSKIPHPVSATNNARP